MRCNHQYMTQPKSILQEAEEIINGPRRDAYGDASKSFAKIARWWSDILRTDVSASQVAQCMIAFKLIREFNKSGRDNRVDIAGYTALLDKIESEIKPPTPSTGETR